MVVDSPVSQAVPLRLGDSDSLRVHSPEFQRELDGWETARENGARAPMEVEVKAPKSPKMASMECEMEVEVEMKAPKSLKMASANISVASANTSVASANTSVASANANVASANIGVASANTTIASASTTMASPGISVASANTSVASADNSVAKITDGPIVTAELLAVSPAVETTQNLLQHKSDSKEQQPAGNGMPAANWLFGIKPIAPLLLPTSSPVASQNGFTRRVRICEASGRGMYSPSMCFLPLSWFHLSSTPVRPAIHPLEC